MCESLLFDYFTSKLQDESDWNCSRTVLGRCYGSDHHGSDPARMFRGQRRGDRSAGRRLFGDDQCIPPGPISQSYCIASINMVLWNMKLKHFFVSISPQAEGQGSTNLINPADIQALCSSSFAGFTQHLSDGQVPVTNSCSTYVTNYWICVGFN